MTCSCKEFKLVLFLSERGSGASITLASSLVSDYRRLSLGQVHAADGDSSRDHRDGRCRAASETSRLLQKRTVDCDQMDRRSSSHCFHALDQATVETYSGTRSDRLPVAFSQSCWTDHDLLFLPAFALSARAHRVTCV
jgi:hypothetical protein